MAAPAQPSEQETSAFEEIVGGADGGVQARYQPIVELDGGAIVGWEALARGPAGSPLEYPDRLFSVAAALGRTAELDHCCQVAAVTGAVKAGLGRAQELFINVEPAAVRSDDPDWMQAARERAGNQLSATAEITERALTSQPAELITMLEQARRWGFGIALDDVGVNPESLSLMPLIRPDVIKLDMSFVQQEVTRERARTVHGVLAEAERSGARVLAEGIEDEEMAAQARALGADLGQGWLYGRPGELTPCAPRAGAHTGIGARRTADVTDTDTPFAALARHRPVRRGTKGQLLEMSLALEAEALAEGSASALWSCFQEARFFGPGVRTRYARIAERAAFVGVLARGLGVTPAPGVRGAALGDTEPLRGEWTVVVLGPHFAGAFAAFDLGEDVADLERGFDYAVTYDRDLVVGAATRLMRRIAPAS